MNACTFTTIFNTEIPNTSESDLVQISKVVVPRIQRAYAQGRTGEIETNIRENFLKDIFESLKKGSIMDLNFIYGAVKERKDNDNVEFILELLDGQQRFTTLYLLHWYILNKEGKQQDKNYEGILTALKAFTYESRNTSTKFCKSLSGYFCDLEDSKPSEKITNARWYYRLYDKDSTIAGMLVMLDAIDSYYKETQIKNAIDRLNNLQFYVLPLMQFKRSEEMYIKMNARGLHLSIFDSFKADFNAAMEKEDSLKKQVQLVYGLEGKKVPYCTNISIKLDSKWIDLFWRSSKQSYDISYMRFFSRFFACRYLIDSNKPSKEMSSEASLVNIFYTQFEKSNVKYFGFDVFAQELKNHPEYFLAIEKILDTLQHHNSVIEQSLTAAWDKEKRGNFFVDSSVGFSQKLLTVMGAIEEFILAFDNFEEELYKHWIRVVWNIVENTDINNFANLASSLRNFARMIYAIAFALNRQSDFIKDKKQDVGNTSSFFKALSNCSILKFSDKDEWPRPFQEEIEKAKRIAENDAWLELFMQVEKHPFFKGTTNFYYTNEISYDEFKHRCEIIVDMFDANGISPAYRVKHVLIRALMSKLSSINHQYITENSESEKHLKRLLIKNKKIHEMFASILDKSNNKDEVIEALKKQTEELLSVENIEDKDKLKYTIACNALRQDVKLYNWINTQSSPVYVHYKSGHIAIASPRVWYERYFIDSDRDIMGNRFIYDFNMQYYENPDVYASLADYDKVGRYKGEEVIFYFYYDKERKYSFNINFSKHHTFRIFVQLRSNEETNKFIGIANVGYILESNNPYRVYMDSKENKLFYYNYTENNYNQLKDKVNEAANKARDTLKKMGIIK